MNKHYGHIIEKVIRRNGFSISELARLMNVNRRSFYNWFAQKNLKPEIIYRIATVLNYDFHNEFPELFTSNEFKHLNRSSEKSGSETAIEQANETHWKNKYIYLLEKYNELLIKDLVSSDKAE